MTQAVVSIEREIEVFERATSVARELVAKAGATEDVSERNVFLGLAAYEVRDYSTALEHLQASFVSAESSETAIRIAMCAYRMQNFVAMEKWATRALGIEGNGSFKMLLFGREVSYMAIFALSQLHMGRIDSAHSAAKKAMKIIKDDATAIGVLVKCHLARGELEEAAGLTRTGKKGNKSERDFDAKGLLSVGSAVE